MLEQLSVRNYVLIDRLDISFSSGFTVLSGETGSGKSIMLGALSLLLGAKADKEAVRQGEQSAEICGVFSSLSPAITCWADEHGIEIDDGSIIIRRLIKVNGRSSYTVNGSPVTVREGEELGHLLVDVSSQHAHQSLLRPDVLRDMVDKAASQRDYLQSQIILGVRQSWVELTSCWDTYQLALESESAAEASFGRVKRNYEAGRVTLSELLQSQASLLQAADERLEALNSYRQALQKWLDLTE